MAATQPVAGAPYPSPQAVMARLITGYWISQALNVAAQLGVADLLKDGPQTIAHLAEATGAHPRSLYRLLRALASEGVFAEDEQGRCGLTPLESAPRTLLGTHYGKDNDLPLSSSLRGHASSGMSSKR